MGLFTLLATVDNQDSGQLLDFDQMLSYFWERVTDLHWLYALLMISVGIVYMLYGWRIFRILVVISFGFLGLFLGILLGQKMGGKEIWGGLIGMALLAAVSVPLMKWCVSILGALAGGIITAGVWVALGLSQTYMPAGFIVGFVAGGLISFIMLKASVMLFTSMGGSLILATGALALIYQYETYILEPPKTNVHDLLFGHQWFLPVSLIVPTVIGMIVQNKFIKHSHKWELEK
jgi:hypothetical protein